MCPGSRGPHDPRLLPRRHRPHPWRLPAPRSSQRRICYFVDLRAHRLVVHLRQPTPAGEQCLGLERPLRYRPQLSHRLTRPGDGDRFPLGCPVHHDSSMVTRTVPHTVHLTRLPLPLGTLTADTMTGLPGSAIASRAWSVRPSSASHHSKACVSSNSLTDAHRGTPPPSLPATHRSHRQC